MRRLLVAIVVETLLVSSLLGLSPIAGRPTPAYAISPQPPTTSIYEYDANWTNLFNQGEAAGARGIPGDIFLDFGRPAYWGNGVYGMIDFGGHFNNMDAIESAATAFSEGMYLKNTTLWGYIDITTNDSCQPGGFCISGYCGVNMSCSDEVSSFTGYGQALGTAVNELQAWMSEPPTYPTYASGGDDAEPGWDAEYNQTAATLRAFTATSSCCAIGDYGSLDGGPCCSNWTAAQQYQVAWGILGDYPGGEIYNSSMAAQWTSLEQWAVANTSYAFQIYTVTTEYPSGYSPTTAWNTLVSDLHGAGGQVSQVGDLIAYATNI